ncbi:hypothetical protein IWQ60_011136 [Tieghemiomyces parasiticus]|uniref:CCHC-type domain-containing protein n=1 Tax=Tieghemiomyces parasiticus TaxID=78921 RepID=A0A9W7ZNN3_9FUNG|nr:hypothetical protein IWQ60_011136 [Tieghemiomyces parasiticus]
MTSYKVLVVGSVGGQFVKFFKKLASINAKNGPFDLTLCDGDFFASPGPDGDAELEQLLSGLIEVAVPTYFVVSGQTLPQAAEQRLTRNGGELCPNVVFLGKSGIFRTTSGIRLAYLSGTYAKEEPIPILQNNDPTSPLAEDPPNVFDTTPLNRYDDATVQAVVTAQTPSLPTTGAPASHALPAGNTVADVDILLTHDWPKFVTRNSAVPFTADGDRTLGHLGMSQITMAYRPRYHFAAAAPATFYEREPYSYPFNSVHTPDGQAHHTRFIGLAAFGHPSKQRWFYAMSHTPLATLRQSTGPAATPAVVCTGCPYPLNLIYDATRLASLKRNAADAVEDEDESLRWLVKKPRGQDLAGSGERRRLPPASYTCKICNVKGHWIQDCPAKPARPETATNQSPPDGSHGPASVKTPPDNYVCKVCLKGGHYIRSCPVIAERELAKQLQDSHRQCWFCLANPDVDKGLIVHVDDDVYLTVAKGGVLKDDSTVPGRGHFIALPVQHVDTIRNVELDGQLRIVEGLERYKRALKQLFAKFNCSLLVFELCRPNRLQQHAHLQMVAIPNALVSDLKSRIEEEAIAAHIMKFDEDFPDDKALGYFKFDLPDGTSLVHPLSDKQPFDMQFGRKIVAKLMQTPERGDWRSCVLPKDEEKALAQMARTALRDIDDLFT